MPPITQMFPSKYLQPEDLKEGVTVVEIEKVWPEAAKYNHEVGDMETFWNIRFREFRKPMKLKAINARTIADVLNDQNTDNWAGLSIGIFPTQILVHGKMIPVINVDIKLPDVRPSLSRGRAFVLVGAKIGAVGAGRFLENLKALDKSGGGYDAFLRWLKVNAPDAISHAFGAEVSDLDGAMVPAMKAYLDTLAAPAPTQEVIDRGTGEVKPAFVQPGAERRVPRPPAQTAEMNPDDIPF